MGRTVLTLLAAALATCVRGSSIPCDCPASVNNNPTLYYCKASGDPHFTSFDNDHFDFMGRGLYELARFTTSCGCDVTVQVLQAQLTKVCEISLSECLQRHHIPR